MDCHNSDLEAGSTQSNERYALPPTRTQTREIVQQHRPSDIATNVLDGIEHTRGRGMFAHD